jgi:hypothetical protein
MNRGPGTLDHPRSFRTSAGSPARARGHATATGLTMALTMALLVALMGVQGCQALGVPAAQTFEERLAAGFTTVAGIREGAQIMLNSKAERARAITDESRRNAALLSAADDAENLQEQADNLRKGLDIARTLKDVDFKSAESRLTATVTALQALDKYLKEQR